MWGFCVPLASRRLACRPCSHAALCLCGRCGGLDSMHAASSLHQASSIQAIQAQRCTRCCSPATPGQPQRRGYSSRSAPVKLLRGWSSCGVHRATSRRSSPLGYMLPVGRGGTEVHGANRGHNARERSL
ncbi:hypothetical protein N431DRAFT_530751 [Stipitochalara longipes BDJ]|nr:hypothetical protein N431DRAFT_530751 [Stipitochalara longipes BDJ]